MVVMTLLQEIQALQFTDREAAQNLLRVFIEDVFSLDVSEVALRPLAVSLNSFNGFVILADDRRLFFKSHVEPGSVIAEYYNSELMQEAGYRIISPVDASTEPGRQMLLYEVVEDESVFDAAWAAERTGPESDVLNRVRIAQHTADDELLVAYEATLRWQDAATHAHAPIHQLFHHRLTKGRLDAFYGKNATISLPGMRQIPLEVLRQFKWQINGVVYRDSLEQVVASAIAMLEPAQAGPAVVGHGDAHNGNVFLRGDTMVYFDPAFAGIHDPLLDLVKPLYHNVHAMWMYFPHVLTGEAGASLKMKDNLLVVDFPDSLHPVRQMFWDSKSDRVLLPLLRGLAERGWLRADWRDYLRSALACCPLLTMNLADGERFPPDIALLGFAHVIEMAARGQGGRGRIECWLDNVEAAL
jgi:hypothetical protein